MVESVGNPYPHRYKDKVDKVLSPQEYELYLENAEKLDKVRQHIKEHPQCVAHTRIIKVCISALLALIYYLGLRVSEIVGDRSRQYKVQWEPTKVGTLWQPNANIKDKVPYPDRPDGDSETHSNGYVYKWTKEIQGLLKQDIRVSRTHIRIDPKDVRKHGKREEPLWIPRSLTGTEHVVELWNSLENPKDKLFPISTWTAWSLISKVTEGKLYPHFFRENRASLFAEDPKTSIVQLQEWFGWARPSTADSYIKKAGRVTLAMSGRLK